MFKNMCRKKISNSHLAFSRCCRTCTKYRELLRTSELTLAGLEHRVGSALTPAVCSTESAVALTVLNVYVVAGEGNVATGQAPFLKK